MGSPLCEPTKSGQRFAALGRVSYFGVFNVGRLLVYLLISIRMTRLSLSVLKNAKLLFCLLAIPTYLLLLTKSVLPVCNGRPRRTGRGSDWKL
jgi:hypothetical protein